MKAGSKTRHDATAVLRAHLLKGGIVCDTEIGRWGGGGHGLLKNAR